MRDFGIDLFDQWTAMWNGEPALAYKIMAPEFTLRYAQPGADVYDDIHDPRALATRITAHRDSAPGLRFEPQGEAVIEMDDTRTGFVAHPYGAEFSGPDGRTVSVSGTDILRTVAGVITEVWSASGGRGGRSYY